MDAQTPRRAAHLVRRGASHGGGPLVVGLSGDPLSEQRHALDFAASEANRRSCPLLLVHGCEPLATLASPAPFDLSNGRFLLGRDLVRAAGDYLDRRLVRGLGIQTEVTEETGVQALVRLSSTARLIVCQRRAVSTTQRWITGSTTSRVCAQAHAPVAVIPTGESRSSGQVVVGVDGRQRSALAVDTAFDEAELWDAELVAVHAWEAPGPLGATGYVPPDDDELTFHRERAAALLSEALAAPRQAHPTVAVEARPVRGPAVEVLVDAAASARLLVVARHVGHGVGPVGLGTVARHVLARVGCPVIVTPPRRSATRAARHRRAGDPPSLGFPVPPGSSPPPAWS